MQFSFAPVSVGANMHRDEEDKRVLCDWSATLMGIVLGKSGGHRLAAPPLLGGIVRNIVKR